MQAANIQVKDISNRTLNILELANEIKILNTLTRLSV
jgi:hypothetical protein